MAFLGDGFKTLVTFALDPAIRLAEKEVTPLGYDGGGMIDTTTMHNTLMRTRFPKSLTTGDDVVLLCSYDPIVYQSIFTSLLQKNGQILIIFPDGSQVSFYGWLDKFKPQALKEGEFPLAEVTIICSNVDTFGVEQTPSYSAP